MFEVRPSWRLLVRKENDDIDRAGGTGSRGIWGKREHLIKNWRFIWLSAKMELSSLASWSRKDGIVIGELCGLPFSFASERGSGGTAGISLSGGPHGRMRCGRKLYLCGITPPSCKSPISLKPVLEDAAGIQPSWKRSPCPEFLFCGGAGSSSASGWFRSISPVCVGSPWLWAMSVSAELRASQTSSQAQQ